MFLGEQSFPKSRYSTVKNVGLVFYFIIIKNKCIIKWYKIKWQ